MIKINDITKRYKLDKDNTIAALEGINLEIPDGELLFIIGKSGSGKSTLLHIIGGLDRPDSGGVFYNDINITDKKESELSVFRRDNIGFVFQDYNLIPELNAEENIKYPVYLGRKKIDGELFDYLVTALELSERLKHLPSQLSGGQQQRVAIARALMTDPSVILCDEPTGNLDSASSESVQRLLLKLHKELNKTVVIVTHDADFSSKGGRTVILRDGKVVAE